MSHNDTPIEIVIDALRKTGRQPRKSGAGYAARCPAHDDGKPSLSINEGDDGRVLVKCHAGCPTEDVVDAFGLAMPDLFRSDARKPSGQRQFVDAYTYKAENGNVLFRVVRTNPKGFYQQRPNAQGGWINGLEGTRRVLYHLPDLLEGIKARRCVWICEGEKDADAIVRAGEVATTNPMGAGNWRPEYTKSLVGAIEVAIVADRDAAGRAHARVIADSLIGHVGRVFVVEARSGKDVSDHLAAGYDVNDLAVTFDSAEARLETATLLDDVLVVLGRFMVWSYPEQADWVALWVLHTYVFDLFDTTPYLHVESASKQSGKSRLVVELLPELVARPWAVFEPSEAVLFRKVDKSHPTLLMDEIDAAFGKDSTLTEGIRAILNVGYRRGARVARCVGNSHETVDFEVFCPKAFAGLKGLPDTVQDRSGRVVLKRRGHHEPKPERFRLKKVSSELMPLRERLGTWSLLVKGDLEAAVPQLPEVLSDRAQDGCEVLAAIADHAGGEWPKRARRAFVKVMGAVEEQDPGILLLAHCREAFVEKGAERLPTVELLRALVDRGDDSPWAEWGTDIDRSETRRPAMRLARLLKPFGIGSRDMRLPGLDGGKDVVVKGYCRADFLDPWGRWLAGGEADEESSETVRSFSSPDEVATSLQARSEPLFGTDSEVAEMASEQGSSDVATSGPLVEATDGFGPIDEDSHPWHSGGRRMTVNHPCQYSPEVLAVLAEMISSGERVHDPFAGPGVRLGALCDRLGAVFSGGDIEEWPGHDSRIVIADACNPASYPSRPFTIVTSPVYVNKRCADYANGPTPTTRTKGRRDYGIALGRPLHPDNLARFTGRPAKIESYWLSHAQAVKHWGERVLLNVDEPISERWQQLLSDHGYRISDVIPAYTRRYGGLHNADKRAEHEVVIHGRLDGRERAECPVG
jgi:hypothetical protein